MTDYRAQVDSALRAIGIHSPTVYLWFGKRSPRLTGTAEKILTEKNARDYLNFVLQSRLYTDFYCQGTAVPSRVSSAVPVAAAFTPFVEALSAVNSHECYN